MSGGYDKLSDRFRKSAAPEGTPAKVAKAAKVDPEPTFSAAHSFSKTFSSGC
jgi:hypothetical protein